MNSDLDSSFPNSDRERSTNSNRTLGSEDTSWRNRAAGLEDRGLAELEHGNYEAASELLLEALRLYEKNDEEQRTLAAAQYLGVALYELGKHDQAVAIWEEMMSRGWSGPTIFGLLARHYERQGRSDEVERLYTQLRKALVELSGTDTGLPERVSVIGASDPGPAESKGPARILIADNDLEVRDILVRILSREGYEIDEATDGEEALQAVLQNPPDLMVLDVYMPKRSGVDVLYQMRARGIRSEVIVISGLADASMVRDSIVLGAHFLGKPFDLEELKSTVRAKVGGAQRRPREGL